jgi:hypothetical protein
MTRRYLDTGCVSLEGINDGHRFGEEGGRGSKYRSAGFPRDDGEEL